MALLTTRRRPQSLLPSMSELFDNFPSFANFPTMFDTHVPRIEDEIDDDRYIVRAELPGMDPDEDITVSVQDGVLTIEAERSEEHRGKTRSEFRYGSFSRSIALPSGAKADEVDATYAKGILSVTIPLEGAEEPVKRVKIHKAADESTD